MKSYLSVDRVEEDFVVGELEMLPVEESKPEDYMSKDTKMVDVHILNFAGFENVKEGQVFVVLHEDGKVIYIDYRDDEEMDRRITFLESL